MAHNGDDIDTVSKNFGDYEDIDLNKVPYVDEYDDGMAMQEKYLGTIKDKLKKSVA